VHKYALEIKKPAQKELDAADDRLFTRIDRKILELADDPRPTGCKKLKRYKNQWRIRVSDWHVVYVIDDARNSSVSPASHTAARFMNDR